MISRKYVLRYYILWTFIEIVGGESCAKLSRTTLVTLLGQAYNPRYMSVEPPPAQAPNSDPAKRSSFDIPFYVEEDTVSNGEFPAWETDHLHFFEKKKREAKPKLNDGNAQDTRSNGNRDRDRDLQTRSIFIERLTTKPELFKTRPWECQSKINWIDLGLNYFPRYVRSVECVAKRCWYGHFTCKARSFTIKVLRRKSGNCAKITDKLIMVVSQNFKEEYAEIWVWEEMAINFCCDCVMVY